MTTRGRPWLRWSWIGAIALLPLGCGGQRAKHEGYVDRLPLPPDTLTVDMAESGRYGGRFVAGSTGSPKTFNPIMQNEQPSGEITQQLFCSLTGTDYKTMADIPQLAKSWEFADGGRTVTFHLRRGAAFSDGVPITSADVRFAFDVVMDDSLHPPAHDDLVALVNGRPVPYRYEAPDSFTFRVHAPRVDALILAHCSVVPVVPRHVLEPAYRAGRFASAYGTNTPPESLVTSGPWRVASYVPDQQTVLTRNPYWFGVDAKGHRLPYLDQVVFLVSKDQEAAAARFKAGELSGLDNLKPSDYAEYDAGAAAGHYRVYDIGASFASTFFWFNLNRAPAGSKTQRAGTPAVEPWKYALFSDPRFRRAISEAIDRDAMIRGPMFGYGVRCWSLLTPGNPRWADSTLRPHDRDPEDAKRLLAAMGLRDRNGDGILEDAQGHRVGFTLATNGDNNLRVKLAEFVQGDLAKVGIAVTVAPVDIKTLVAHVVSDFDYDACLLGLTSAVPADPGMGGNFWKSSGRTHFWHPRQQSPELPEERRMEQLFDDGLGTLDLARRRALFHDLSQTLLDSDLVVWLPIPEMRVVVSDRFGNVDPSPMPHRILWNCDRIFEKAPRSRS